MHMITDGNGGYIRQNCDGKFVVVRNIALGDSWDSKEKAQNVLSNQISPLLRGKFSVAPADEAREGSEYSAPLPADISFSKMLELLEAFDIDNDYLRKLLSDVDKDIGDIEHYIELKESFNVYDAWIAFSNLRSKLKERRKIKDKMLIYSEMERNNITRDAVNNLHKTIAGLEGRKYAPRKLLNLFTKGEYI